MKLGHIRLHIVQGPDNNLKLKHAGTHEYLSDFKWKRLL